MAQSALRERVHDLMNEYENRVTEADDSDMLDFVGSIVTAAHGEGLIPSKIEAEMKSARRELALTTADGFERVAAGKDGMVARAGDVVIRAEAYLAFLNGDAS